MKEMKIKVDGVEIELTKEQIEKINKPKDITDRIKTFEDALEDNNISELDFKNSCKGLEEDEVAYRQIKLIIKSLNQGWNPDWNNGDEHKYYTYFDMRDGCGFSSSYYCAYCGAASVGSRLCFKSSKLAEYAGKQFASIYKKYMK